MIMRILRAALVPIAFCIATPASAAYTYWLDHDLDSSKPHYRSAGEACYIGELQSRLDYRRSISSSQYRISAFNLGPDNDIQERTCRGVIEVFSAGHWVSVEAIDTSVFETSTTAPSCPISGLVDPETGLCGVPKCDGDCPTAGGNSSNPIDSAVGNKLQNETDYEGGGSFPIRFERYYNSIRTVEMIAAPIGIGWSHSYSGYITPVMDYVSGSPVVTAIRVYRPHGAVQKFTYNAGSWVGDADTPERLTATTSGGYLTSATYTRADDTVESYNADGRLISITRRDGLTQTLSYTTPSGLTSPYVQKVTDPNGRSLTFSYTGNQLTGITDTAGTLIQFAYTGSNLTSATYPIPTGPVTRTYFYNESGQTGGVSRPYALTGIQDEQTNRYVSWGYDSSGRANLSVHGPYATGTVDKTLFTFNANGTSTITSRVTSTLSAVRTYSFVASYQVARLASMDLPCDNCSGAAQGHTYDTNGFPNVTTDFRGTTLDQDFNTQGMEIQRIEAANDATGMKRTIQTDWDSTFRVPLARRTNDATGTLVGQEAWAYNSRGQVTARCLIDPTVSGAGSYVCGSLPNAPNGVRQTAVAYCESGDVSAGTCPLVGLMTSMNGPRTDVSDTTTYTYYQTDDATCATAPATCPHRKGDLWKVTNALGQVTETLKYDGAGRVLSVKDANGVTTDFEYHPRGWLTARKVRGINNSSENDDQITQIEYWPTGLVKQVTQPDGSYTGYTYDAAHRLTDIADTGGNTIHYTLDDTGNRWGEDTKNASATTTRTLSRVYNNLSRLQTQTDSQLNPTDFTYDNNGNPDLVTDALTRVTDNDYDPLNRLKSTIQDLNGIAALTQFNYDALDNLIKVTDPKGLDTNYTYNGLSDLLTLQSPDTGTTIYTYDSGGNRQTQKDARLVTTTYSYDTLNRLMGAVYPTTSLNIAYAYDTPGAVCQTGETFGKGRLAKITDASGSTSYCYGRFGDLLRKVQVTNGKAFTVRYGYDRAGRMTSLTYPDGTVADYVRDGLGNITETGLTRPSLPRVVVVTGATYAPFGPSTGWTYAGGRTLTRPLDLDYRPAQVFDNSPGGGLSYSFGFDLVGNLDTLQDGLQALTLARYRYDGLNRLDQTQDGPTGTPIETYGYDATGNRKSVAINGGGTTNYTYPAGNHRLFSVGGVVRQYDTNGNTTNIGGTAKVFRFNDANRMDQVKASGTVLMNYAYNGKGEQVRRYLSAASNYTVYDEAGHWLGDYNNAGTPLQQAVWMDDLPVGLVDAGNLYQVEPDHLGTPRAVIDPAQNVAVWRWDLNSEVFGATVPNQDPDMDGTNFVFNLRYPGQRYDSATGLNYNYFRDYDVATGRYLESDPIGLKGGLTTYSYAASSPQINIDRFGLIFERCPDGSVASFDFKTGQSSCGHEETYCGSGLNEPLVPDSFFGFYSFRSACRNHDNCYGRCGVAKETCDTNFKNDMLTVCNRMQPGFWANHCRLKAGDYYDAVRLLGGSAYRNAQARCKCPQKSR